MIIFVKTFFHDKMLIVSLSEPLRCQRGSLSTDRKYYLSQFSFSVVSLASPPFHFFDTYSEWRLVIVDGLVPLQRTLRSRRAETFSHVHQSGPSQRGSLLRGHVGAEEHLQHTVSR